MTYQIVCPYYQVVGQTVAGDVRLTAREARDSWMRAFRAEVSDELEEEDLTLREAIEADGPKLFVAESEEGLSQADWEHLDGEHTSAQMYGLEGWVFMLDWSYTDNKPAAPDGTGWTCPECKSGNTPHGGPVSEHPTPQWCEACGMTASATRTLVIECLSCSAEIDVTICEPCLMANDVMYVECPDGGYENEIHPRDWWEANQKGSDLLDQLR